MPGYTYVKVVIEERVAVLTVDRPPVNALSRPTLAELDAAFDALTTNDQVKAIVLTGAGERAFVAGADINELAALRDAAAAREFILMGQRIFDKIEACPKPVIAAVNAAALGGGLELALACHMRIVAERARFGQTESNLGLVPGWGGTQRLPRLIGAAKAIELILTGELIGAQEAYRLGLANRVVPSGQALAEAKGLAQKLAAKSGLTNAAALRAITSGFEHGLREGLRCEADQFSALIGSNDTQEGIGAFLQKRQPKFKDS